MLQIKTIKYQLDAAETFDKKVNEALADGWKLTKREVLPPADLGDRVALRMLYAELERESITEAEHCCENCAHFDTVSHNAPCCDCSEDADKWEAPDA